MIRKTRFSDPWWHPNQLFFSSPRFSDPGELFHEAARVVYTVTFQNTDGTVLSRQLIPYGYEPAATAVTPTQASDRQYHYSFSGWSPAITAVAGETTYTAAYSAVAHRYRTSTTAATCTASGKTVYSCSSCGYSYSKTLAATAVYGYHAREFFS